MLRLAELLLPTSRLWLPGMRLNPLGRFGVCGTCCGGYSCGGACDNGLAPEELNVVLDAFENDVLCSDCEDINGLYVLPYWKDLSGQCAYRYDGFILCPEISPPGAFVLTVLLGSGTDVTIQMTINLGLVFYRKKSGIVGGNCANLDYTFTDITLYRCNAGSPTARVYA